MSPAPCWWQPDLGSGLLLLSSCALVHETQFLELQPEVAGPDLQRGPLWTWKTLQEEWAFAHDVDGVAGMAKL